MNLLRPLLLGLTVLTLVAGASAVRAAKVYRWTDSKGVTHYGDHVPDAPTSEVKVIPVASEPSAIARLRVEQRDDRFLAFADNHLNGPIEVRLAFARNDNMRGQPGLPTRVILGSRGTALLTELASADPSREGGFELSMDSLPGDPNARAEDVEYLLPLEQDDFRIDQGYRGSFSHSDEQNRHAIDFAAPIGTPVLAARAGVVMQVESDFDKAGLNRERYGGRANFIRIVHDDGTMALYAHLKPEGVMVRAGQRVKAGQRIGLSGNTGFTTGPHLHFVVQINRGMRLESVPVKLVGPRGPLRISGG